MKVRIESHATDFEAVFGASEFVAEISAGYATILEAGKAGLIDQKIELSGDLFDSLGRVKDREEAARELAAGYIANYELI